MDSPSRLDSKPWSPLEMKTSKTFSIIIICLSYFISVNINAFESSNQPKNTPKDAENTVVDHEKDRRKIEGKKAKDLKALYEIIMYFCSPHPSCSDPGKSSTPSYDLIDFIIENDFEAEELDELDESIESNDESDEDESEN